MTEKEEAIREVLIRRADVIDIAIIVGNLSREDAAFYEGKREGLMQAYDLVAQSLESILVEIEHK